MKKSCLLTSKLPKGDDPQCIKINQKVSFAQLCSIASSVFSDLLMMCATFLVIFKHCCWVTLWAAIAEKSQFPRPLGFSLAWFYYSRRLSSMQLRLLLAAAANANKSNDTMFEFFFFGFYIHYFLKVGQSMLSRLLFMYYLQKVKWYKWLTSQKNKKHSREELRRKKQCNVSRPILMKLETQMLTTKNNLLFHEAED